MAWLPHTTRSALRGLCKRGVEIDRPRRRMRAGSYVIVDNPNPRNGEDAAMRKTLRSTATQTVRRRLPAAAAESVRAENPLTVTGLQAELAELASLSRRPAATLAEQLGPARAGPSSRGLLIRVMAYRLQAGAFGDLNRKTVGLLERMTNGSAEKFTADRSGTPGSDEHTESKISSTRGAYEPLVLKSGAVLTREWHGRSNG